MTLKLPYRGSNSKTPRDASAASVLCDQADKSLASRSRFACRSRDFVIDHTDLIILRMYEFNVMNRKMNLLTMAFVHLINYEERQ